MDWKDMLGQLAASGSLPEGEEVVNNAPEERKAKDLLHVVTDKKGRKGKTATIIEGFTCDDAEVSEIAADLKKHLGVGGSARGGEILIQGDCAERVRELLRNRGYKVR